MCSKPYLIGAGPPVRGRGRARAPQADPEIGLRSSTSGSRITDEPVTRQSSAVSATRGPIQSRGSVRGSSRGRSSSSGRGSGTRSTEDTGEVTQSESTESSKGKGVSSSSGSGDLAQGLSDDQLRLEKYKAQAAIMPLVKRPGYGQAGNCEWVTTNHFKVLTISTMDAKKYILA